jgi:phage terminase large subunit-like protein
MPATAPLMKSGTPKLSEVARHVILPKDISSSGWPAVRDRAREMGLSFDEWQIGVIRAILAKRADGKYAATVGGVAMSIPRQTGKTYTLGAVTFALCLGNPGTTVLWTAHRMKTAKETFRSMQGMAKRKRIAGHIEQIFTASGSEEIKFHNGSRIMFGARETGFGRGFAKVDIEVFDEAQILTERALDDMLPAMNAAPNALALFTGTPPRLIDPGEVFERMRSEAIAAGSGKSDGLYIEFSADKDASPDDLEQQAKANPSFPHRTPIEAIQRMRKQLSEDSFLREGMGIWDADSQHRVIAEEDWDAVSDAASMAVDRLTLGIDVPPDRSNASVGLAGLRADGLWHVEMDEEHKGTDWVIPWVVERARKNRLHAVVVDEMSGLVEKRRDRNYLIGTDVLVTLAGAEGRDMAIACAKFYDAVMDKSLRHTDQSQVNVALSVARKRPLQGGWAWNRKDIASDITPVVAETLALWGAQNENVNRPTRRTSSRTAVIL